MQRSNPLAKANFLDNALPIIDLRPSSQFIAGHLAGATNIPLEQLNHCWHELPPKGARLHICVNRQQATLASEIFAQQHYQLEDIIIAETLNSERLQSDQHSRRLWQASPLLENSIELIKGAISQQQLTALDIGCGAGRDSIFLALHGFSVTAIDNSPLALQRLEYFANRWQPLFANPQIKVKGTNLNLQSQYAQLSQLIEFQKPNLVLQCRYLHRPLLDIYQDSLQSGAIVAIHTFLEGAAAFGKPKNPAYLLNNNELAKRFSDWKILSDQIHYLKDGRPLSLFIAQKP